MLFAKKYKKIPDYKDPEKDPFSDKNLEAYFHREDSIQYNDRDLVDGKIAGKDVAQSFAPQRFGYRELDDIPELRQRSS